MNTETKAPEQSASAVKTAVILLAAGLSSRMGARNKLLIEFDDEPLVRRTARTYLEAGADLYVVLGHEANAIREALAGLPLTFLYNPDFAEGQQRSVRAGVEAVPEGYDAVLVALSDQAALTAQDIRNLLQAFAASDRAHILIPHHDDQRGNPVVFPSAFIGEIRASGRDMTCRKFIDANPQLAQRFEAVNDHFTVDIDTPDDLISFQRRNAP